ncbi:hypothetical protein RvY_18730 [Ramazzottius varieornatus]|uniref:Uncharacterized protein n=1 Tax=Ramazzottius varieornatus TaxID=947166 RepID=A0A1D1W731_RAMVA|nr:hypothetical protein RvY_18730 [Ramazzottius varieornatus]
MAAYLRHRRVIHQVAAGVTFALFSHPVEDTLALSLSSTERPPLEGRYKRDIIIAGHALREVAIMMNKRSNTVFGQPGRGGIAPRGAAIIGNLMQDKRFDRYEACLAMDNFVVDFVRHSERKIARSTFNKIFAHFYQLGV